MSNTESYHKRNLCVQTYEDYRALNKVLAVFYESGRLFREYKEFSPFFFSDIVYKAAGHMQLREAKEDVVISIPLGEDDEVFENVAIDKGTVVSVLIIFHWPS